MDESDALEALSTLLTEISENPYNFSLHAQHLKLASSSELADAEQVDSAREMMSSYFAAGDELWIPLVEGKEKALESAEGEMGVALEETQEVLQTYERAEKDYLSIPLLSKHVDFLASQYSRLNASEMKPSESEEAFSLAWTRTAIEDVVTKASLHITEGQKVWDKARDWALEMLETASGDERLQLIAWLDELHLSRLQKSHSAHDETFQSYSSFTSNFKPPQEYEELLVAASKLRSKTAKGYEYRDPYETSLAQAGYSLSAYNNYIAYERRAKKPDLSILAGIYERAIAEAAKRRFEGEEGAEAALSVFWTGYADALRIHQADQEMQIKVLQRGLRSVPGCGELWARYIRFLEEYEMLDIGILEPVSGVYDRAMGTGLFVKDPEEIVPLVLARAGYEKRRLESVAAGVPWAGVGEEEEDMMGNLFSTLQDGIKSVRSASKAGDPRYRLEKFLAQTYTQYEQYAEAAQVWRSAAEHYKASYVAWTAYADALVRDSRIPEARKALEQSARQNGMDWPEAIWEAWLALEHAYGTVQTLQSCLDSVERGRMLVGAKRAREAEKAMQLAAQQQAANVPVSQVPVPQSSTQGQQDVDMDVDGASHPQESGSSLKRKAEEPLPSAGGRGGGQGQAGEGSKKVKIDSAPSLKRDRENCTVFVADLPSNTTDDDLKALFKDCGSIRDIKITSLPNTHVATVEFSERESVPAALTKDKKRINGEEVAVHLAWRSTLYVTNFPERVDDEEIRKIFGKYGLIFDVRWPSKKFKATRRFCYVQFTSPDAAKASLELHSHELEPNLPLNVYISNPERKKERTDADANAREVYVSGLSKFAEKSDLERVFKTYGHIKEIRMTADEQGRSKGFAFVEFEQEKDALNALNANNHELKARRMAVTMSDSRVRSRRKDQPESGMGRHADTLSRSLRVRGLPPATQEGLLQQTLEKLAPAKRVEVFEDKHEAVVEFQNVADVAKLLLSKDAVDFNGATLTFSELTGASGASGSTTAKSGAGVAAGGLFVPRTAVSRPRAGLGHARKPTAAATSGAPAASSSGGRGSMGPPAGGRGQDDFRKMLSGGK